MSYYENVETARAYDFWCGVWLLSNAIGRTIRVERPHAPVYFNTYAILCAEAGITRKTTAVRYATDILREYALQGSEHIKLLAGSITSDALDRELAKHTIAGRAAHVSLSSTELISLLGRDRYAAHLPGKLTDLYDCPDAYERISLSHGVVDVRNVYVTLLAASTPSWLLRAVNPDVVEGGFTSRCLFIIEEEPKRRIAWPEEDTDVDRVGLFSQVLHRVRQEAHYVAQRAGGIRLTTVARKHFTDWYERRQLDSSAFGASFQAREDHHILRLAGILSVSDNRWEVDEHHIANAIRVVEYIRQTSSLLFGSGMASSKTFTLVDKVRGALVSAGTSGISQSALHAVCRRFGNQSDLKAILTVMHEMQLVQVFRIDTGEKGRPVTMYRATRTLAHARAVEEIVDMLVPQEV